MPSLSSLLAVISALLNLSLLGIPLPPSLVSLTSFAQACDLLPPLAFITHQALAMSDVEISSVCRSCEFPFPGCHGSCKKTTDPIPTANWCGTIWGKPASLSEIRLKLELNKLGLRPGDPEFVYYGKMRNHQADAVLFHHYLHSQSYPATAQCPVLRSSVRAISVPQEGTRKK